MKCTDQPTDAYFDGNDNVNDDDDNIGGDKVNHANS